MDKMKDGQRVEVLLNRGEADVWYAGTTEGVNVRLDDNPFGEPLVTVADITFIQPELDPKGHYLWTITDEITGKRRKASWRMQPADARLRFPDAWPHVETKELRGHVGGAGDLGRGSVSPASALPPSGDAPEESKGR